MSSGELLGLRILVVEDDPIVALGLGDMLTAAGANLVGPAYTVAKALEFIANQTIDAAVLDYRLEKETALPVAAELEKRHIPFLFHTSSRDNPKRAYPNAPLLDKPTPSAQLVAEIRALVTRS